jgi:hypothetical protein
VSIEPATRVPMAAAHLILVNGSSRRQHPMASRQQSMALAIDSAPPSPVRILVEAGTDSSKWHCV